jgi:hypothetical protein
MRKLQSVRRRIADKTMVGHSRAPNHPQYWEAGAGDKAILPRSENEWKRGKIH